jgi:hypothetical protein
MKLAIGAVLALSLTGCILAVVAVAAALGVGAYLYLDNVLSYEYEEPLEKCWDATRGTTRALGLKAEEEKKDFQEGIFESHMADGRQVGVICQKLGEKKTRIKVRVGDFKGESNRQAAQSIHERIAAAMDLKAPALPVSEELEADEMKKMYKGSVGEVYDAAMKACEGEGYRPQQYERSGEERGTIAAQGKGRQVYVTVQQHAKKTRVVIQVKGPGGTDENKKAAKALHEEIGDALKDRGED